VEQTEVVDLVDDLEDVFAEENLLKMSDIITINQPIINQNMTDEQKKMAKFYCEETLDGMVYKLNDF
jgi:hypothetical protein